MKTVFSTILLITLLSGLSIAQPNPDTLWTLTLGGSGQDHAKSIVQTTDGGYAVAGYSQIYGTGDYYIYLVKIDDEGDTLWTRTYGVGSAYKVIQTTDGGYAIGGNKNSDFYLVRTDNQGDTLWTRTYGGTNSEILYSAKQTTDGGYILVGETWSFSVGWQDFYLVKTDSIGDTLWTRTYGGVDKDVAYDVQLINDGGYIVVGYSGLYNSETEDFYVVVIDSNGDELWTRTYGCDRNDRAYTVLQTSDGDYIIAGSFHRTGVWESYLVRINSTGDTLFTRAYSNIWRINSIRQLRDGGFLMAGTGRLVGPFNNDFWLIKTNSNCDTLWTRFYGGNSSENAYSALETHDGAYIIAGNTYTYGTGPPDFYIVKTGPDRHVWVVSPNCEEQWRILTEDTVRWASIGYEGTIAIDLKRNFPEGDWEVIVDSTENDGQESVFITDPLSDYCRVRIRALEDTLTDISDDNFSIISSQGYLALITLSQSENPLISWDVGTIECPQTITEIFLIKNFGNEAIIIYPPDLIQEISFSMQSNCDTFNLLPGEVSTCSLTITYDPLEDGIHHDTLLIMSDAVNSQGGYVRIPLTGQQMSTPATPIVTISIEGDDARLTWEPITESILGCSIDVAAYLVFYSPTVVGPYYFHGLTADTTYVHNWVVPFASGMFYEALAYTGELDGLDMILDSGRTLTHEEVIALLNREGHHRMNR